MGMMVEPDMPKGAVSMEVSWFDADGLAVSAPKDAAYGEVYYLDADGNTVMRTYLEVG